MDEVDIKRRLYSVIPSGTIALHELLKLSTIRFDEKTQTAAVTCTTSPQLLLNKEFVEKHCQTDEHLFMLIMHELYHIILGHTRLFKNPNIIDNIVFDAVINANLCKSFPSEEYTSFFTNFYKANSFPECLLRPLAEDTPEEFRPFLRRLYHSYKVTYEEIRELFVDHAFKNLQIILLGNHSGENDGELSPIIQEIIDKMVKEWPEGLKNGFGNGKGDSDKTDIFKINMKKAKKQKQEQMNKLLKKAGIIYNGNFTYKKAFVLEETKSLIPNFKDRTLAVKKLIYPNVLLYNSTIHNYQLVKEKGYQTFIYLDVSGSVYDDLQELAPLLLKPYKNKECQLFVFSTIVEEVSYENFKNGIFTSTGGTDVNCIMKHFFSIDKKSRPKKILILTDGFTGTVKKEYYNQIKNEKIEVYCGLFGWSTKFQLENIVKYFEVFENNKE